VVLIIRPKHDNWVDNLPPNVVGNTPGNINNAGFAAIQGNWIYFLGNLGEIYRMRPDGSRMEMINEKGGNSINVVGDWIYYINTYIYKMRLNGSRVTQLNSVESGYLTVIGDWIYYTNTDENMHVYKMKTDGSEVTKVVRDAVESFTIYGDWIYYSNFDDEWAIYKIRTDGTGRERLDRDESEFVTAAGDKIYYMTPLDFESGVEKNVIFEINTDGTGKRLLWLQDADSLNLVDEWIYFSNIEDDGKIYRIPADIGALEGSRINNDFSQLINVVGDWIFYLYTDNDDMNFLTKIRTDGTGRRVLP